MTKKLGGLILKNKVNVGFQSHSQEAH